MPTYHQTLPPSLPAFPRPLLTVSFMASFSSLSHAWCAAAAQVLYEPLVDWFLSKDKFQAEAASKVGAC